MPPGSTSRTRRCSRRSARASPGELSLGLARPSWLYPQKITIDHTLVAEDLTDFPVLITGAVLQASLFTHARSDGAERTWGYIVGTYDKDAGANNQGLYLNGTRVAQMSDTQPIDLNSAALGIGRHTSDMADPFNGHIDEFRIAHVQRSDGWIATTWNNMSDPGAFAAAGAAEHEDGERPPLAGAGVVVCPTG